jgi:flagellar biosynthesis anti-sigma factor FlgM
MKIDPLIPLPGEVQTDSVQSSRKSGGQSQGSSGASATGSAAAQDTVNISSTHGDVQTLKANFSSVPEVRTSLVTALQQKVNSGQYAPSSAKIVDAIINDQASRAAKASSR